MSKRRRPDARRVCDSQPATRHAVPDDICGYVHDLTTVEGIGSTCCFRPVLHGGDHCVWHADTEDVPSSVFREHLPDPGERLDGASIPAIDLRGVDAFQRCSLIGASLDSTVIRESTFCGADLREARFDNVDARRADFSRTNLSGAAVYETDFRGTDFSDVRFDQAILSNTRVNRETNFGQTTEYERELQAADSQKAYRKEAEAAVWTYREIHLLFVENALPLEARQFYYREKDTRRRLAWHMGNYARAIKAEASRWVTGYGMNPYRVVGTAVFVILLSALLYPVTGGIAETIGDQTIQWTLDDYTADPQYITFVLLKSLYFSIITFTTLGYGDIRPVGNSARAIAGLESLLGALLTALLVFVLSRRIS